jgi:hypothetical protein
MDLSLASPSSQLHSRSWKQTPSNTLAHVTLDKNPTWKTPTASSVSSSWFSLLRATKVSLAWLLPSSASKDSATYYVWAWKALLKTISGTLKATTQVSVCWRRVVKPLVFLMRIGPGPKSFSCTGDYCGRTLRLFVPLCPVESRFSTKCIRWHCGIPSILNSTKPISRETLVLDDLDLNIDLWTWTSLYL